MFTPIPGEIIQFDYHIFFRVGLRPTSSHGEDSTHQPTFRHEIDGTGKKKHLYNNRCPSIILGTHVSHGFVVILKKNHEFPVMFFFRSLKGFDATFSIHHRHPYHHHLQTPSVETFAFLEYLASWQGTCVQWRIGGSRIFQWLVMAWWSSIHILWTSWDGNGCVSSCRRVFFFWLGVFF